MIRNESGWNPKLPFRAGVDVPFGYSRGELLRICYAFEEGFQGSVLTQTLNPQTGDILTPNDYSYGNLVQPHDVERYTRVYKKIAAWENPILNLGTQQTLELVKRYALVFGAHLADKGLDFNLNTLQSLALGHDHGRTWSHRRRVNDLTGAFIMKKANFNPAFMALFPTEEHWFPIFTPKNQPNDPIQIDKEKTEQKYLDLTPYTREAYDLNGRLIGHPIRGVIEIADVLGKIDFQTGKIINWSDVGSLAITRRQNLPDRIKMWGGEYLRQLGVVSNLDIVNEFYRQLGSWLEEQMNFSLQGTVEEVRKWNKEEPIPEKF